MKTSITARARISLALVGVSVVALTLSSCSVDDAEVHAAGLPAVVEIVPISPVVSGTAVAAAPVAVAPPTTPPPVVPDSPAVVDSTVAPESSAVVESTVPVDTATTLPPETTTTVAPLAINQEQVGAFPTPIVAVGKRSGADTQVMQLRLLQLGFWLSGADGDFGLTTRQAVMAFQKYLGLPSSGLVDADTAAYLTALTIKGHGQSDAGTLVEVDKGKQLLFFIVDGKTQWVFNTSTATGLPYEEEDKNTPGEIQKGVSITPDGLWKVNRERPEGWWEGDLGKIYRPKYFRGGVAVHGSNSIPNYPASHGCVRLSVPAMDFVWDNNMMPMSVTVWVHE